MKSDRKNAPKLENFGQWSPQVESGGIQIIQQERKDVGESSKIHHFFEQDLPAQLELNFEQNVISGISYTRDQKNMHTSK